MYLCKAIFVICLLPKSYSVLHHSLARLILLLRSEAALAQLVEHRIRNAGVACSSHASGTILGLTVLFCYSPYVVREYAQKGYDKWIRFIKLFLKHALGNGN